MNTQSEAKENIKSFAKGLRDKIMVIFQENSNRGYTTEEMAIALGYIINPEHDETQVIRPRMSELKNDGKIEIIGKRPSLVSKNFSTGRYLNIAVYGLMKGQALLF